MERFLPPCNNFLRRIKRDQVSFCFHHSLTSTFNPFEMVPFSSSSTFIRRWLKSKSKKNNHTVFSFLVPLFNSWTEGRKEVQSDVILPFLPSKVQTIRQCFHFLVFFTSVPLSLPPLSLSRHPSSASTPILLSLFRIISSLFLLTSAVKQVVKKTNCLNSEWLQFKCEVMSPSLMQV